MPITISLTPNNVDSSASNFVYAIATLTFSGSYPTGGDTVDFLEIGSGDLHADGHREYFARNPVARLRFASRQSASALSGYAGIPAC